MSARILFRRIPSPSTRLRARIALVAFLAASIVVVAWISRAPLLAGLADLWIVSDALAPADAVVILGGGLETRPFAAAEYYRAGLAKKVLVANVRPSPSEKLRVTPAHSELNRAVLLKLGVSREAIGYFGNDVSSTREEAVALRRIVEETGLRTLLVPTDAFSSRRVRWMLRRALEGTGARAIVLAVDPFEYTRHDWWRHEQGLIAFQNEAVKHLYYRLKY